MRGFVLLLAGVVTVQAGSPAHAAPQTVTVETFAGKTPTRHSPAYAKAPEADRAFAVIDAALKRLWELPDPRESLAELVCLAAEADPVLACDRAREVGVRLQVWVRVTQLTKRVILSVAPTPESLPSTYSYLLA